MIQPGDPVKKLLWASIAVIVACEVLAYLLARFGTQLCVLLALAIIARLIWFYTNSWR